MNGLIATKIGMSRVFLETGEAVPVTYVRVEPNTVVRTKSEEKDGYNAIVLGIAPRSWKTRKGKDRVRYGAEKEWKVETLEGMTAGSQITAETIAANSIVTVTGISKGKGFQGVMKRHHFSGGPRTHGSHFQREPGSVGMREKPGRIHKGKRMAGHMGTDTVTILHRPVVIVDHEKGVLGIKGPLPGPNGSTVFITVESAPQAE